MPKMITCILLSILLLMVSQCGPVPGATSPATSTDNAVVAETTAVPTELPDATPTTEAATATPVAEVPQESPTPAPATEEDADEIYAELVAQFGEDYESCQEEPDYQTATCEVPDVLAGSDPAAAPAMQIILDSSGSMAGEIDGQPKITAAKAALLQFLEEVPENAQVAFRVYGHTGSNDEIDRAESCDGTELLYPFQPLDMEQFETALDSFEPTGWTPIALSLEAAQADFAALDTTDGANLIYLVSDGIETCDGDPVAAAQNLHESDIQAVINVIGFDVDAEAAAQLQAVAEAGGGEYIEARTKEDIWEAFRATSEAAREYYDCVVIQERDRYDSVKSAAFTTFECIETKALHEFDRMEEEIQANYDAGLYERKLHTVLIRRAIDQRTETIRTARRERVDIQREAFDQLKDTRGEAFDQLKDTRGEAFDDAKASQRELSDEDKGDNSSEDAEDADDTGQDP